MTRILCFHVCSKTSVKKEPCLFRNAQTCQVLMSILCKGSHHLTAVVKARCFEGDILIAITAFILNDSSEAAKVEHFTDS